MESLSRRGLFALALLGVGPLTAARADVFQHDPNPLDRLPSLPGTGTANEDVWLDRLIPKLSATILALAKDKDEVKEKLSGQLKGRSPRRQVEYLVELLHKLVTEPGD